MGSKVSVIIRTSASRVGCLEQAISSVSSQRYENMEIVVVENGSKFLKGWVADKKIMNRNLVYRHQTEPNRCTAGNLGLSVSTGDFICFLDDDDILYPNHLDVLTGALENDSSADAAYAVAHEVRSRIKSYAPFQCIDQAPRIVFRREFSKGALFVNNFLPIQTVLFRRTLFEKYGGFDSNLQRLEDWDLWVRYASHSKFVFVDAITSMYRVPCNREILLVRNREHNEYYPQARAKQAHIQTSFDLNLFDEIVAEIFRPAGISNFFLRHIYRRTLNNRRIFNETCEQWKINLKSGMCEMSVLEAIRLTSEVITKYKVLWGVYRVEHFIMTKFKEAFVR